MNAREAAEVEQFINSAEHRAWERAVAERWARQRGEPSPADKYAARLRERRTAALTAASARRRAAKLKRTPRWADRKAVRAIYALAREMTSTTGKPHHVDHIIPLRGRLVSWLHVENNLQILPGSENCRKRNHFEVEP